MSQADYPRVNLATRTGTFAMTRLDRLSAAVLLAIGIAIIITLCRADPQAMVVVGDYPGFHVLGEILRRGQTADLYVPELQWRIENELWPSFHGSYYQSVYPPYMALVMLPFAILGPTAGRLLFLALALSSFVATVLIVFPRTQRLRGAAALALLLPILQGTVGGQLVPFLMLLVAGIYRALERRDYKSSGLLTGLLLVKPQVALIPVVLLIYRTRRQELIWFGGTALAWYGLGSCLLGPRWPLRWIEAIAPFAQQNSLSNLALQTSLVALPAGDSARLIGILVAALALIALFTYRRIGEYRLLALGLAAAPILVPQTLYYDLAAAYLGVALLMFNGASIPLFIIFPFIAANAAIIHYRSALWPAPAAILAIASFLGAILVIRKNAENNPNLS